MTQSDPANTSVGGSPELPDNWRTDASEFGARLALIRWQMGWNLKEAAIACGLPAQSWRTWELDRTTPRDIVAISKQISERTRCDYLWLLLGESSEQAGVAA